MALLKELSSLLKYAKKFLKTNFTKEYAISFKCPSQGRGDYRNVTIIFPDLYFKRIRFISSITKLTIT